MRLSITVIAVVLVSTLGAAAQTPDASSSASHPTISDAEREHPDWFKETYEYRPCPVAVVFGDEHHACLGTPTAEHYHGKVRRVAYRGAVRAYSYYHSGCSCSPSHGWW
jgi:hypothetical protein